MFFRDLSFTPAFTSHRTSGDHSWSAPHTATYHLSDRILPIYIIVNIILPSSAPSFGPSGHTSSPLSACTLHQKCGVNATVSQHRACSIVDHVDGVMLSATNSCPICFQAEVFCLSTITFRVPSTFALQLGEVWLLFRNAARVQNTESITLRMKEPSSLLVFHPVLW